MQFLTRFSLKNPVAVLILAALLVVGGVLSALGLQEALLPNISVPVLAVVTPYPDASPAEVARDVAKPLEEALAGVAGVQTVTSTSVQNLSVVGVELTDTANLSTVESKVQQTVSQVVLPKSALTPAVQEYSLDSSPMLDLTVTPGQASDATLRQVVNQTILPQLRGVAGVASVQTSGAQPDIVSIKFHADALLHQHLTMAQVVQDLQADNLTTPTGSANIGGKTQPVQIDSALHSIADIRNLPITIVPNSAAGLTALGSGEQQLGRAVGSIGQGVGQLGQAVGLLQAENKLVTAIQSTQGQLFGTELALGQLRSQPAASGTSQQQAQLESEISGLQRVEKSLTAKLQQLQGAFPASATPSADVAPTVGKGVGTTSGAGANSGSAPTRLNTVPLSSLATVTLEQPSTGAINRTNGQPSVLLSVTQTDSSNTVTVANAVQSEVKTLEQTLPDGIRVHSFFNSATSITASVNGMLREAILGALFAMLVILLFLRNWRTTVIAVISIPLSILMAVILLARFQITLNIMTLGGLAVATGRVVDDSIVVIENIHRNWRRGYGLGKRLVSFGVREVARAITTSTLTTMAVFVPLGLVSGVVGKVFRPFALTVVFSLLSSLLVALTVVPLLAWLLIARRRCRTADYAWLDSALPAAADTAWDGVQDGSLHPDLRPTGGGADAFDATADTAASVQPQGGLQRWQHRYRRLLSWCLNHKKTVFVGVIVAFVASIAVLPLAGSTFLPQSQEKYATITVQMPTGTDRAVTLAKTEQVENVVLSDRPTVSQFNSQVGSDPGQSAFTGIAGPDAATLFLKLQSDTRVSPLLTKLRQQLQPITGDAKIQVKSLVFGGSTGGYSLLITGPSTTAIDAASAQITAALQGVPGLANVTSNVTSTQPQLRIIPNQKVAASYGLTSYQIATAVQGYLSSQDIGSAAIAGHTYEVDASLQKPANADTLSGIRSLPIMAATGQQLTLSQVASVADVQTPVSVLQQNGSPYAQVSADFTNNNTGSATNLATQRIDELKLPSGVQTQLSGDSQNQDQSFKQLIEAILAAVGIVYIVMLIAFGEWSAPFAILFSMPVALIGAFFGTVIGHQTVSVSSLIGVLMLMGIVVTNAIVLVDRVEQQRRQGKSIREALLEAGTTRLRPILMTAIATICALVPLAIGFAEGALISQGLAVVVIGGLVTSTALTLVIVPMMYEILHFRIARRERQGGADTAQS